MSSSGPLEGCSCIVMCNNEVKYEHRQLMYVYEQLLEREF